jgi:D-alanyl-D-alanine carboxypeptidase (penicillin-binding protein 5/6)
MRRKTQLRFKTQFVQAVTVLILVSIANISAAFSPDEDLTARAALLMDASTGKVLYQKDADLRLPPASTTKILTAIITLESGRRLKDLLTVSKADTRVPASKLYLRPGQTISIEDLLYALLLSSANDASLVLAEGIGGSVEHFADLMTKKAHDLGAVNSHFSNPHGLTAPDHYSTARDLAVLFRYAMKNPMFREIVQTRMSSVSSNSVIRKKVVARRISVRNHNRLLWNFDGAIGGKTGYTVAAQKCFVGAVQRNGVTLIVSILGAHDQWGDTKRLLEYGFDNYDALKPITQAKAPVGQTTALRPPSVSALVAAPQSDAKVKGQDGYFLQIGAFRERDRAESLMKQIADKGFTAFIDQASTGQGLITYRVRTGPFSDPIEAQEMAGTILGRSGQQFVIVPAQVDFGGDPS